MPHRRHGQVQAPHGRLGVLQYNWNLAGTPQVPSHKGITEKLFLRQDPELERKVNIEHRNVQRRKVIHHVNLRLRRINLVQPFDLDLDADGSENHLRP